MSISHGTLREIGASEDSVQFPPESGGGYIGYLEVFHQIHRVVRINLCCVLLEIAEASPRICYGRVRTRNITRTDLVPGQIARQPSASI